MLLREFVIDSHVIRLSEIDNNFVAEVANNDGEKLLYREFSDYEPIKDSFNQIIEEYEAEKIGIDRVLEILENTKS
ncbi:MAG: hypothetical protein GX201_07995 [Clostridiales bacterium]|nr:hypothetical protein [Clostridiales bacterium]